MPFQIVDITESKLNLGLQKKFIKHNFRNEDILEVSCVPTDLVTPLYFKAVFKLLLLNEILHLVKTLKCTLIGI